MDRRSSKLCPVAVGLFALIVVGCTKKPESYSLTDLGGDRLAGKGGWWGLVLVRADRFAGGRLDSRSS